MRRFVRAFAQGAERMKADPALAQAVIRQYLQSDDSPALEWGYRVAVESMPAVPYPSEAGLQSVIDALAAVDCRREPAHAANVTGPTCVEGSMTNTLAPRPLRGLSGPRGYST